MKIIAILLSWIFLIPVSRATAQDKSVAEMLQQVEKDMNDYFYDRNKGVATLTAIIARDPGNAKAYNLRAHCYIRLANETPGAGYDSKARKDYEKSMQLDPSMEDNYLWLSTMVSRENPNLAIQYLTKFLELKPGYHYAYFNRGEIYRKLKQYDNAIADLKKAVEQMPDQSLYYRQLGEVLHTTGRYEEAASWLKRGLDYNNRYSDLYIRLAASLARLKRFDEIAVTYKDMVEKKVAVENINLAASATDRSIAEKEQKFFLILAKDVTAGAFTKALAELDPLIAGYRINTGSDPVLYGNALSLKGFLLEMIEKKDEAKIAYEKSLAVNSAQPDIRVALAALGKGPVIIAESDIAPPAINIISPIVSRGLKITQKEKQVLVKGTATDESGVASVSVNGVQAKLEGGYFSATVPLKTGDNALLVKAVDQKSNEGFYNFTINRIPDSTEIIPVPNIVSATSKYYALVIGIQDYVDPSIQDLEQPVGDASSLYEMLVNKYSFERSDATLLKNPTRSQLFQALESLSRKVGPEDNLLIFYAGHGYWDELRKQGYWFPSDAGRTDRSSWITNADLKEYISSINSKHTLLITDACFAGSIFKSRAIAAGAPKDIRELYDLPSRKAMTSGTLKEVPDKSVFIEYLIKRLAQNNEQYLSAEQLFSSFRTAVINNSANGQVPQFGEIKEAGDEGGDFIFIRK